MYLVRIGQQDLELTGVPLLGGRVYNVAKIFSRHSQIGRAHV